MRLIGVIVIAMLGSSCLQSVSEGKLVGPGGGMVSAFGVELTIPPGALSGDESISIAKIDVSAPAAFVAVGDGFRLQPEGLRFRRPVQLSLPLRAPASEVAVATAPSGTSAFQMLWAHSEAGRATVMVSHFSVFLPVAPSTDAGLYGLVPGLEVERCQPLGEPIHWWTAPGDLFSSVSGYAGPSTVTQTETGYVFTSGRRVMTTDRALSPLASRDTLPEAPEGGFNGLCPAVLDGGVMLASARASPAYVEWQVDSDGQLVRGLDGGPMTRDEAVPGTYAGLGFTGPAPGCGAAPRRDALLLGADPHDPASAAVAVVPRDPSRPIRRIRLPASFQDASGGVELADGSALFALHRYLPAFGQPGASIQTQVHRLNDAARLVPVSPVTSAPVTLTAGGAGGAVLVEVGESAVWFTELDAGAPSRAVTLPDAGAPWMVEYDPVRTTPSGNILVLVMTRLGRSAPGGLPATFDLALVRDPRGDVVRLASGLGADETPGFGAVDDESVVIVSWNRATGLRAARLCLPP